jgi:hypothetical protein
LLCGNTVVSFTVGGDVDINEGGDATAVVEEEDDLLDAEWEESMVDFSIGAALSAATWKEAEADALDDATRVDCFLIPARWP